LDVSLYESKHSFVWKYAADLIELLSPKEGEGILDLGCGTGHLTHQIAATGATVVGIDSDPAMIAEARKNYPKLRFEVGDGENFRFTEPFDAVFSNAAIHWMTEPGRVVACIWRSLKPGGRLVAEFGGKGNLLEDHGFRVTYAALFDRLTPLESGEEGLHHWIEMFGSDFLIEVPAEKRSDVIRHVENRLRPDLYREGTWFADYKRIRVVAVKE
jgi:trans-aconitate 2-methyltransferase